MKLYLKQKVFSWKDQGTVKDENGNDIYYIEGKILSIGKQLTVRDSSQREVAFIKQKVLSFLPRFFVEINGEQVAEIVKKISFLKQKYVINGPDWDVEGDFFAHDYSITDGVKTVASIHKKWMTWGDTFEIDIDREKDEVLILALVLAIDAVMDANSAAASSASSGN